jgi:RNA polymerase sigma factor (sigma-70 family)
MPGHEPSASAVPIDELLVRVEPRVRRLLSSYRIPRADAEDVLHQSLLALLYHWDRVGDPECWLLGTLKRHCLMYWRRHRRQLYAAVDAAVLDWFAVPAGPPTPARDGLQRDLESVVGRLAPHCRKLLELRFRLGYTPPEAAARLGCSPASVGKITSRCLAALSNELFGSTHRHDDERRDEGSLARRTA